MTAALVFAPDVDLSIYPNPTRNLFQRALYARHLWGADVGEDGRSMAVQRRERDIVKVDETDVRYAPAQTVNATATP